nr:unnamed protein product [Callosobruchus analis]
MADSNWKSAESDGINADQLSWTCAKADSFLFQQLQVQALTKQQEERQKDVTAIKNAPDDIDKGKSISSTAIKFGFDYVLTLEEKALVKDLVNWGEINYSLMRRSAALLFSLQQ